MCSACNNSEFLALFIAEIILAFDPDLIFGVRKKRWLINVPLSVVFEMITGQQRLNENSFLHVFSFFKMLYTDFKLCDDSASFKDVYSLAKHLEIFLYITAVFLI